MEYTLLFDRVLFNNQLRILPYLKHISNESIISFSQETYSNFNEVCQNQKILFVKINNNHYIIEPEYFLKEYHLCRNLHDKHIYFDNVSIKCNKKSKFYKACLWILQHNQPNFLFYNT